METKKEEAQQLLGAGGRGPASTQRDEVQTVQWRQVVVGSHAQGHHAQGRVGFGAVDASRVPELLSLAPGWQAVAACHRCSRQPPTRPGARVSGACAWEIISRITQ